MAEIYSTLTPMLIAYNNGITTAQRNAITNPLPSTTIYNTDTSEIEIWDGTQWQGLKLGSAGVTNPMTSDLDANNFSILDANDVEINNRVKVNTTYGGINQVIQSQGSSLPAIWKNNYPDKLTSLPVSPNYGDQFLYSHSAAGNINALLPMIYDGIQWRPIGSATLCRWDANTTTSQTISTTTIANITMNDYNTITFTPPFTGYYEVGQTWFRWELNSGIGMSTYFSATDGSENHRLYYTQDWNGPYQHWRAGVSCPIVVLLSSSKTYRFTANLTYAAGNTGLLVCSGGSGAYVKALSA